MAAAVVPLTTRKDSSMPGAVVTRRDSIGGGGGGGTSSFFRCVFVVSLILNILLLINLLLLNNTNGISIIGDSQRALVIDASLTWKKSGNQSSSSSSSITKNNNNNNNNNNIVYGHVHMAKTAGTEINGELAARYERVCGHKGYSYDSHKDNDRAALWIKKHPNKNLTSWDIIGGDGDGDVYSRLSAAASKSKDTTTTKNKKNNKKESWNRGRVPAEYMDEIGYHDCDWISREKWAQGGWTAVHKDISPMKLELHIPCRQPIDHLLSMCNYQHYKFPCDITTEDQIQHHVNKCLIGMKRFDGTLFTPAPDGNPLGISSLKCFNPIPIEPYLEYMDTILQPKRRYRKYVHRETNDIRNKSVECLRTDTILKQKVEDYLISSTKGPSYFRFCHDCMGSNNDLLLGLSSSAAQHQPPPPPTAAAEAPAAGGGVRV